MNYYEHHIGDYAAATSHLSWDEDMAYTRLIRAYYQHERAIPAERKAVYRLARAASKSQRDAVDAVLDEFFVLADDGWHQKRCDEEVERYVDRQASKEGKRENETERQRRHRERRKELFEALRAVGEVPKWDTTTRDLETLLSRVSGVTGHAPATATQAPSTSHQTPDKSKSIQASAGESTGGPDTSPGRACGLMRQAGCIQTNPSNPNLLAAIAEGVSPEALAATAREAIEAGATNPFKWAIATARNRHAQGVSSPHPTPGTTSKRMTGLAGILGVEPHDHEAHDRAGLVRAGDPDRDRQPVPAVPRRLAGK
ncbi:MAG: YdaU family protein [Arenimonas sp.]